MPIFEDLKEYAERATGLRRPGKGEASDFARARKPHTVRFKDDGLVPNHPRWPLSSTGAPRVRIPLTGPAARCLNSGRRPDD
jgi:hypothetical protein